MLSRVCTFLVQLPFKGDDKFSKDNTLQMLADWKGKDICSICPQYYPPGLLGADPLLGANNKSFASDACDCGSIFPKDHGKVCFFIIIFYLVKTTAEKKKNKTLIVFAA